MFGLPISPGWYVSGGLALALVGGAAYHFGESGALRGQIGGLQEMLKTANDNLGRCQDGNVLLKGSISEQNAAIDGLRERSETLRQAVNTALAAVRAQGAQTRTRIDMILNAAVDPNEDRCVAALREGRAP